jgi:hypothetical protein
MMVAPRWRRQGMVAPRWRRQGMVAPRWRRQGMVAPRWRRQGSRCHSVPPGQTEEYLVGDRGQATWLRPKVPQVGDV